MVKQVSPLEALTRIKREDFISTLSSHYINGHSIPSQEIAHTILETVDTKNTGKVLIIGSGSGYLPALFSCFSSQVLALEKNHSLAKVSKKRFEKLKLDNINVLEDDFDKFKPANNSFDTILIFSTKFQENNKAFDALRIGGDLLRLEKNINGLEALHKYTKTDDHHIASKEVALIDFSRSKSDILIDLKLFDASLLQKAKIESKKNKSLLIDELRKLSNLDDIELYRNIAQKNNIALGDMDELLGKADAKLFQSCSRAFLDTNHLIPVYREGNCITVATNDPDASIDVLKGVFPGTELEKVLVTSTDFHRLWSMLELGVDKKNHDQTIDKDEKDLLSTKSNTINPHLISLFDAMLLDAVAERASDIHIEQYSHSARIRLRVDGDLNDLPHYHIPVNELKGLINVIKLRAKLDISEKRLPQGGRSRLRVGKALYDLRVQTQPALHGEHVIIRLLPQNSSLISIEQLGFSEALRKTYQRLLYNPSGMLLVVGPTGSGKSTTLYAGLKILADDKKRKVITIEDPIEYSLDNIQQSQTKPEINFNFHDAMRAFVREDPDVIFVGEIRDTETALEAVRASQTGHLVLSTLHSNDAVDSLQRLYDLDIQANSLASEILAVVAQRLAKKICKHCRTLAKPDSELLDELFPQSMPKDFVCYEGKGCVHCNGKGTYGRIAIFEFMPVTEALRDAISRKPSIGELRKIALNNGLVSMRSSALEHVQEGIIPLTELPKLIPLERLKPEAID